MQNQKTPFAKQQAIEQFDPDGVGLCTGNIFGLPFSPEQAELIVIPVPWEVTVSYRTGTADGPAAILAASPQLDLCDPDIRHAWQSGIAMLPISDELREKSRQLRKEAAECIAYLERGGDEAGERFRSSYQRIDGAGRHLRSWLQSEASSWLDRGKIVAVLGGDHSVPLGLIDAMAARNASFAILQIDAHADLREAYEGFSYSHASIMHNALQVPQVGKLVQVGLRDFAESELRRIRRSQGQITAFLDRDIQRRKFVGEPWQKICGDVLDELPENVYISFDIDGLAPYLCPNTGTPVPGGLDFEEAVFLIEELVRSGRRIIGFDLCEVAAGADEWDANVGARLLYRLATLTAVSQGRLMKS